jgi:hypothetical protein
MGVAIGERACRHEHLKIVILCQKKLAELSPSAPGVAPDALCLAPDALADADALRLESLCLHREVQVCLLQVDAVVQIPRVPNFARPPGKVPGGQG